MCANKQPNSWERARRTGGGSPEAAPRSKPGRVSCTAKNGLGAQPAVQRHAGAPRPVERCCSQLAVCRGPRAALPVRRAARVPVSPSNAASTGGDARALDWVNLQSTGQPKKTPFHPSRKPHHASRVAIEPQTRPLRSSAPAAERPAALRETRARGSGGSTAAPEHETGTHTPPQSRRRAAQQAAACPPSPPRPTFYTSRFQ